VEEDLEDEILALAVIAELNNDAVEIADLDLDGVAMDDSVKLGLDDDKRCGHRLSRRQCFNTL